jgi:hypothetical protein
LLLSAKAEQLILTEQIKLFMDTLEHTQAVITADGVLTVQTVAVCLVYLMEQLRKQMLLLLLVAAEDQVR